MTGVQTCALPIYGVPDGLGALSPTLAVMWRQVLAFQATAGQPLAAIIDVIVLLPLFVVLNFVGLALFSLVDRVWKGEAEWDRIKPIWGALIFATIATLVVLGSRRFGLPPFAQLGQQFLGVVAACALAGLMTGIRRVIVQTGHDY